MHASKTTPPIQHKQSQIANQNTQQTCSSKNKHNTSNNPNYKKTNHCQESMINTSKISTTTSDIKHKKHIHYQTHQNQKCRIRNQQIKHTTSDTTQYKQYISTTQPKQSPIINKKLTYKLIKPHS